MIRTACVALFLLIYFVISLPLYVLIPFIARFDQKRADRMSQSIVCWALRWVTTLAGMRVKVQGLENIPRDEPVLYIANHRSYFDIVATYPLLPNQTAYVAKKEIDQVPLLKYWMRLLHGLTFDREDPRSGMNMIIAAIDEIKKGYSIFIFPEGTRSRDGKMGEFKAGSFKVATRTNCPIVPVSITGTDEVFEKYMPSIKAADVRIVFGVPFRPSELAPEEKKHIARIVQEKVEAGM
ncbi:MAG: 1-acyl-sn-glycerol-3-phosphate acyltransferase [Lachnospiraceae bacterium]|nr:1-acyl-sn-glycerol-3-phosphate acyltransferase [Lachnospiraceae bacterium]